MTSVIKTHGRGVAPQRAIFADLFGFSEPAAERPDPIHAADERAAEIIAAAQERAAEIVASAKVASDSVVEDARRSGWAQGQADGEARWRESLLRVEAQADAIRRERDDFFRAAEAELVGLSTRIASKLLHQELSQNPDAVLSVVRAALARVEGQDARLIVDPGDLDRVRGILGDLREEAHAGALEIAADPQIGPGGCIVEMPTGSIDARLDRQLAVLDELLVKASVG